LDTIEGAARSAAATLEQARAGQQAAERSLRETRITCPFSGHVAERMVEVGQMVGPSTPLARLVDVGRLKLSLSVTGDQLARIRLGQEVTLVDSARPLERFTGAVSRLGVAAEESTHTFPVEVSVEQASVGLRAGQVVRSSLTLGDYRGVLAVPVDAVQQDGEQPAVFVVREGRAHRVPVRTGAQVRDQVVIESGLSAGDRVIGMGSDGLAEGAEVMVMGAAPAIGESADGSDPVTPPPPDSREP
jgi:membrane fusion protein (multidrug efflux system)